MPPREAADRRSIQSLLSWEWFTSLDFDWQFLSGKRKFRWPMVTISRMLPSPSGNTHLGFLLCKPLLPAVCLDRNVCLSLPVDISC